MLQLTFLIKTIDDLFILTEEHMRVLVFPPVSNFRRFLIHKLVDEKFPLLKTFSVGEGFCRRTVICFEVDFKLQNLPAPQEIKKPVKRARIMPSVGIYRPPAARKLEKNAQSQNFQVDPIPITKNCEIPVSLPESIEKSKEESQSCDKARKKRRPDMAVYVPRGQRIAQEHQRKLDAISLSHDGVELQLSNSSFEDLENLDNEKHKRCPSVIIKDTLPTENKINSNQNVNNLESENNQSNQVTSNSDLKNEVTLTSIELQDSNKTASIIIENKESEVENSSNVSVTESSTSEPIVISEQSTSNPVCVENKVKRSDINKLKQTPVVCSSNTKENDEVDDLKDKGSPTDLDWDVLYDDEGECLEPSLIGQLTNAVGQVAIETPKSSYDDYKHRNFEDEFPHVVEVYNFPPEFKTPDLVMVFSEFKNSGFEIKWVDDTHALGIFKNAAIVSQVLEMQHPFVKLRCLSEGSEQSKSKAKRCADSLTPYMPRPDTCAALARRLVTGALGVKLPTQRAEREAERKLLREAREKKKLAAKQREEAWEGTFS